MIEILASRHETPRYRGSIRKKSSLISCSRVGRGLCIIPASLHMSLRPWDACSISSEAKAWLPSPESVSAFPWSSFKPCAQYAAMPQRSDHCWTSSRRCCTEKSLSSRCILPWLSRNDSTVLSWMRSVGSLRTCQPGMSTEINRVRTCFGMHPDVPEGLLAFFLKRYYPWRPFELQRAWLPL